METEKAEHDDTKIMQLFEDNTYPAVKEINPATVAISRNQYERMAAVIEASRHYFHGIDDPNQDITVLVEDLLMALFRHDNPKHHDLDTRLN